MTEHFFSLQEKEKNEPPEQPEVTVLNTLRILSAMEHLLGPEQGYKTNILLAQAKSLEAKQGSKSAHQLLERQETLFLNYLLLKNLYTGLGASHSTLTCRIPEQVE